MTNKLVVIINSLKVPKIKKILLYGMKFLVPNYSCLQNPWLGGYRPQIPILSVLCPQLNLLNPPPSGQNSWVRHWQYKIYAKQNSHNTIKYHQCKATLMYMVLSSPKNFTVTYFTSLHFIWPHFKSCAKYNVCFADRRVSQSGHFSDSWKFHEANTILYCDSEPMWFLTRV